MPSNVEMTEQGKKDSAEVLSRVLADTYILYLKTHSYHWNVEGPMFPSLHDMFEKQYRNLWSALDDIAERIRALGEYAPGTHAAFKALATVEDGEGLPDAKAMVFELVADNEIVARTLRSAISTTQSVGDEASADLMIDRLSIHEKQIWMMKSTLKHPVG